jgi:hypothetical protein
MSAPATIIAGPLVKMFDRAGSNPTSARPVVISVSPIVTNVDPKPCRMTLPAASKMSWMLPYTLRRSIRYSHSIQPPQPTNA